MSKLKELAAERIAGCKDAVDLLLLAAELVAAQPSLAPLLLIERVVHEARIDLNVIRDKAWKYDELSR